MVPDKRILISEIAQITKKLDYRSMPFLYHLPELMLSPALQNIDAEHALKFVRFSMKHDSLPMVKDALTVLNRIVDPESGNLKFIDREVFSENRSFFWTELGSHTRPAEVVTHIFNKTIFMLTVGKQD